MLAHAFNLSTRSGRWIEASKGYTGKPCLENKRKKLNKYLMVTITIMDQTYKEGTQCCNAKHELVSVVVSLIIAFEVPIEGC